jgi:outer membrane lipoprotein SlyB
MARLALSVVGGILGAIFIPGVGASLGFALGSLAGGIIGQLAFPGKGTHVYGPRA